MTTNVTHNETDRRYELSVDGQLLGVANYHRAGDLIDFTHTEIVVPADRRMQFGSPAA